MPFLIVIKDKTIIMIDMNSDKKKPWAEAKLSWKSIYMSLDEILSLYLSPFGKKSLICRKTGMNKSVTQPKFSRSYAHQKTLSNISKRLAKRNISLEFVKLKTNSNLCSKPKLTAHTQKTPT